MRLNRRTVRAADFLAILLLSVLAALLLRRLFPSGASAVRACFYDDGALTQAIEAFSQERQDAGADSVPVFFGSRNG